MNSLPSTFASFAFSTAYAPYAPYALKYERVKYEVKAKEVKTKDYHLNKVPHGTIYDGREFIRIENFSEF